MPLIRDYPQADTILGTDAFVLDRIGVGTMFTENLLGGVLVTLQGVGSPGDGAWLGTAPFPLAVTFPADWGEVFAWVLPASLPTADAVFTIYRVSLAVPSGVVVGTVTISPTGVTTGDTSGLAVDYPARTAMVAYCPASADATLADFAISFLGAVGSSA